MLLGVLPCCLLVCLFAAVGVVWFGLVLVPPFHRYENEPVFAHFFFHYRIYDSSLQSSSSLASHRVPFSSSRSLSAQSLCVRDPRPESHRPQTSYQIASDLIAQSHRHCRHSPKDLDLAAPYTMHTHSNSQLRAGKRLVSDGDSRAENRYAVCTSDSLELR